MAHEKSHKNSSWTLLLQCNLQTKVFLLANFQVFCCMIANNTHTHTPIYTTKRVVGCNSARGIQGALVLASSNFARRRRCRQINCLQTFALCYNTSVCVSFWAWMQIYWKEINWAALESIINKIHWSCNTLQHHFQNRQFATCELQRKLCNRLEISVKANDTNLHNIFASLSNNRISHSVRLHKQLQVYCWACVIWHRRWQWCCCNNLCNVVWMTWFDLQLDEERQSKSKLRLWLYFPMIVMHTKIYTSVCVQFLMLNDVKCPLSVY